MPRTSDSLSQLRRFLGEGHEPTLADLVDELDLSRRQVRRLIRRLREDDVPVTARRDGRVKRFFLPPEHRPVGIATFDFEEEEVLALAVAAEAAKAALRDTPMGRPLAHAFKKLLNGLDADLLTFELEEQPARWHFDAHAYSRFDPHIFRRLQAAINENRSVRIDYVAASTGEHTNDRKIDPLQMARYSGTWAVVAWCHLRQNFREFALSGIQRLEPCRQEEEMAYFSPPAGFDPETYFSDRFSALSGDALHRVRLLVESDRAEYFRRKQYHASQEIDEASDGRIVVSYLVESLDEIRSFAQSWGVGVTALAPRELVELLAREARELAVRYRDRREDSA